MTVSVVIPCYRQGRYLADCVESVRAQTASATEILVACGDDDALQAARRLGSSVQVLSGLDRGVADARNVAIAAAKGTHILPLDSDDRLEASFLEDALRVMPSTEFAIVSTNLQEFGDRMGHWDLPPYSQRLLLESNLLCAASVFTKALWRAAGGYDVSLIGCEDWSFWVACSMWKPSVVHIPKRALLYRVHGDSAMQQNQRHELLMRAMMRVRHPRLYHPSRLPADLETIGAMPDSALAVLERRISQFPDNGALHFFRGIVRGYRGDLAGAMVDYQVADSGPNSGGRTPKGTSAEETQ